MVEDESPTSIRMRSTPGQVRERAPIAHEMAHVGQGVQAALSSPPHLSQSVRGSEAEASRIGRSFSRGQGASKPTQRRATARSRDADAEGVDESTGLCPEEITLSLGGVSPAVPLPSGNTNPSLTVAFFHPDSGCFGEFDTPGFRPGLERRRGPTLGFPQRWKFPASLTWNSALGPAAQFRRQSPMFPSPSEITRRGQ